MAACLRGGCRAPLEAEADARNSEAPAVVFVTDSPTPSQQAPPVKSKLRSALRRSAAPGRVADVYKFGRTLGTGGYAVVKAATHMETGERVAIKVLKLPDRGDASSSGRAKGPRDSERFYSGGVSKSDLTLEDIANEIEILKALNHPSVLRLYEHYVSEYGDKVYLITELLEGGELLDALLARGNYSEADAMTIMRPVLQGLAYLHNRGVTHRDLKLENLLLADTEDLASVKIADFGLAKAAFRSDSMANDRSGGGVCGTPSYLAPEIISGQRYTPAVDCWAAGVCLYILLSGVVPFYWTDKPGADMRELFDRISAGAYSLDGPEWEGVSEDAKDLVRNLLCVDMQRRLTAKKALAHRWFSRTTGNEATFLAQLPAAQEKLRNFAASSRLPIRRFRAGDYLVRPGERPEGVYLIRTGECDILGEPPGGGSLSRVGTAGEGDFVGRDVALDGRGNAVDLDVVREEGEDSDMDGPASGVNGNGSSNSNTQAARGASAKSVAAQARPSNRLPTLYDRAFSVRARTDVEVVVLGHGHVQGALAKDPAVQTEVQSILEQRRQRQPSVRQVDGTTKSDGLKVADRRAMVVFCGIDNVVFEATRSVEAWWSGLTMWTTNLLQGKL